MKHLFTFTLLITISFAVKAQNLNTAKDATYLSDEEKKVIYLMNLARHDGQKFAKEYLDEYVEEKGMKDNRFVKSLYKTLLETKGLTPFLPSQKLTNASDYHAKDMGKSGEIGHNSTNGTSFAKRLRKYSSGGAMGENCSYGYDDAVSIVMQLLIDKGVPSLGHRKNILKPAYKYVGVAIEVHKKYRFNCVQDFSTSNE